MLLALFTKKLAMKKALIIKIAGQDDSCLAKFFLKKSYEEVHAIKLRA